MSYRFRWMALLTAGALLAGCAQTTKVVNPVTGRTENSVMDEATEVAEGRKAHQEVLGEYGVYGDAKVQAYVNDLGQRLAKNSHRPQLQWTFTVLDSPQINAFALPGGFVYVTRGIMAYMESEADLAGVIGHEIGHVTARHGAQRATRQAQAGAGVTAAAVLGVLLEGVTGVSGAAGAIGQASQAYAAGRIASYSRDQELQADGLGAEYLARSNYNPSNMVDVIGVLKSQERFAADAARAAGRPVDGGRDWLSSHPSNEQRLQEIRRHAGTYQGRYGDDQRARYLKVIEGLPFGESREQGVTRGRNFYHEGLGIAVTAPQGWEIQNTPSAITIANEQGDAGLVIQLAPPKAGSSHEEIWRNLFKASDGKAERGQINGFAATHFQGTARTPQGQGVPVITTIVSGPQSQNYVLLYASKDQAALRRSFNGLNETERSFRPLSAADRLAAKPQTLRLVPYPRGGFAELARRAANPQRAEAQLRLINGFYEGGEPRPGELVKLVE
jgi:predicted Zn-dependent protease